MRFVPKACYIPSILFYKLSPRICICTISALNLQIKYSQIGKMLRDAISPKGVLHFIIFVLQVLVKICMFAVSAVT